MPLNTPDNAQEIENRSKVDVQTSLPQSNPFLPESWFGALITTFANRIFDFYQNLNLAVRQTFWNTSTDEFLEEQASWFNVSRLAASQATGNLVITGVATTVVNINTEYVNTDGIAFTTDDQVTISVNAIDINQITSIGGVATVNTNTPHELSTGVSVTISAANETEYNGTFTITAIDSDTFTYLITGSPASPATGTILGSATTAYAAITSVDFTSDANLDANAELNLSSPIAGVDSTSRLDTTGTNDGAETESDEDLRGKFLQEVREPVAHFNDTAIEKEVFATAGVSATRVFVQEITPLVGQITIYFMKDNDTDPIPTATDLANVKNQILTIKPSNTSDDDVIVSAPTPVPIAFNFSSLDPNTETMKTSIESNLLFHFQTAQDVDEDVELDAVKAVISTTIDFDTGARVTSFSLSTPTSNTTIADDEIATLGSVTF